MVRDDRDSWKIKHCLSDSVLLLFFARLAGAEYWEDIEDFGKAYESSLRRVLKLENGIPSMIRCKAFCDFRCLSSCEHHSDVVRNASGSRIIKLLCQTSAGL